jgi:rRNA maturation protein Rpf1
MKKDKKRCKEVAKMINDAKSRRKVDSAGYTIRLLGSCDMFIDIIKGKGIKDVVFVEENDVNPPGVKIVATNDSNNTRYVYKTHGRKDSDERVDRVRRAVDEIK